MIDMAGDRVDVEEVEEGTPQERARRISLQTVDQVRVEMARVYREVRAAELAPDIGSKLIWMLVQLAKVNEVVTVERRLREIERMLKGGPRHGLEHET